MKQKQMPAKKTCWHLLKSALSACKLLMFLLSVLYLVSCSSANISKSPVNKSPVNTSSKPAPTVKKPEKAGGILQKYSKILNVPVSKLKTPKLYEVIDQWLGVPYRNGGMTKTGIDCSGFVNIVYKTVTNKTIPRTTKDLHKAISPTKNLIEGDLVFFDYAGKNSHVGIYLHNGKFVHASTTLGVTISDINSDHYRKTFNSGGPLKIGRIFEL